MSAFVADRGCCLPVVALATDVGLCTVTCTMIDGLPQLLSWVSTSAVW